jgi:DNA-nicking Smr family endonuclease
VASPGDENRDDESDEARLFREAVRGVRPLGSRAPVPGPPKVRPRARFTRADRAAVLQESLVGDSADPALAGGEELIFHRPQVQLGVLRRLRRGEYRVQREIDLHGLTVAEAKRALRQFLIDALEHEVRCVRIIHGKGLRSKNREPVLKTKVANWLIQRDEVLAFCQARQVDGGGGAVMVLLKSAAK